MGFLIVLLLVVGKARATPPAESPAATPATYALSPEPARPSITHRAWLADLDSSLSPEQALARPWTPYQGTLHRGFRSDTTWLRLTVDPLGAAHRVSPAGQRLVLVIGPQQIDEVAVFLAARADRPLAVVGDTVAPAAGQPRTLWHLVVIPEASEPLELLLRVRNRAVHNVEVQALRWDDAMQDQVLILVKVVAFLVFVAVVTLWAGFVWLGQRDMVVGLFVIQQLAAMILTSLILGVVRLWAVPRLIPPVWVDHVNALMVPIYTGLTVLFHFWLLRDLGARQPERRWLALTLVPFVIALLLLLADFRVEALRLTQLSVPLVMPLYTIVAWRCRLELPGQGAADVLWRRTYVVGTYLVMTALTMPQSLRALGFLPAAAANFSWFMTYSLVATVLMGGLLRFRGVDIQRRQREVSRALAEARQIAQLRQARVEEQSELVTMLTHELKTPLSVVSLALGDSGDLSRMRQRARQAVRSMREIIDRCAEIAHFDDRTSAGDAALVSEPVDLEKAVSELVALQDQPGRVKVALSPRLPQCLTDRKLLLIILGNLLENALKYAPPAAQVRLNVASLVREGRAGVCFDVMNPVGRAGRPEEARLFEKYHRGAYARHRSGSGLGLYLSKRLAMRLGGELSLCGGEDVHFRLWIPV